VSPSSVAAPAAAAAVLLLLFVALLFWSYGAVIAKVLSFISAHW
jgi:hypothetical protein